MNFAISWLVVIGLAIWLLNEIIKMYKKNQERLKNFPIDNMEEMMRILKVQQRLIDIRGKLAELLKTVVLE